MARTLYRFHVDCKRMGVLRGLWTAEPEEVAALVGKTVEFGEVLGKHSEIIVDIEESHIVAVTDDPAFVAKFDEYDCGSGFDPRSYIEEEGEDEEDDEGEEADEEAF